MMSLGPSRTWEGGASNDPRARTPAVPLRVPSGGVSGWLSAGGFRRARSCDTRMLARMDDATRVPADPAPHPSPMTLYICTTCRDADHVVGQGTPCAGTRLYDAVMAAPSDPAVRVIPVECLSVCKRTCAVGFAAPGKWTYVYGDLPAETAAPTILHGARLYAEAKDGLIPWKQRPDALKKGAVARVPPMDVLP